MGLDLAETTPLPEIALPEIKVPTRLTLAALVAGLGLGAVLPAAGPLSQLAGWLAPLGALWLKGLTMTVVPLVTALIIGGFARTAQQAGGGALARRAVGWMAAIYAASAAMGAIFVPALLRWSPVPAAAVKALGGRIAGAVAPVPGFADFLTSILPGNVVAALSAGDMLPVIAFFALFGLALARLGEAAGAVLRLVDGVAAAMVVMVGWVLWLAPVGVFALALGLAAKAGTAAFGALAHYVLVVSAAGVPVLFGAVLLAMLGRVSPRRYLAAMAAPGAVALASQSSLASLPAMLAACRRLGLAEATADFVLPLSVALLRATGPAMNLAAALYVAHLTGVPVGSGALIAGAAVAALTEISSPSLPGAVSYVSAVGPVALAMGVPLAPLGLLVAVDMLPDMMRTVGNVSIDVALVAAVARERL